MSEDKFVQQKKIIRKKDPASRQVVAVRGCLTSVLGKGSEDMFGTRLLVRSGLPELFNYLTYFEIQLLYPTMSYLQNNVLQFK